MTGDQHDQFVEDLEARISKWQNIAMQRENENVKLRAELAKYKLRWQTGKPPKDGWYWVRKSKAYDTKIYNYSKRMDWFAHGLSDFRRYPNTLWAGPISEPEGE